MQEKLKYLRMSEKVRLVAHCGGEGEWPSNTIFAYQQAAALGADVLELDIHSTKDSVLVVRHDPFVESTTNGRGFIRDLALEETKQLDAGYTWTVDEEADMRRLIEWGVDGLITNYPNRLKKVLEAGG